MNFSQATGAEDLERMFWKALQAKDWKELDYRLAANFVSASPSGLMDKPQTLEHLKQFSVEEYSLGDFRTEMNGETFTVVYTLTLRGSDKNGHPLPPTALRCMSVWQEQKKGWVEIAHSTMPSS